MNKTCLAYPILALVILAQGCGGGVLTRGQMNTIKSKNPEIYTIVAGYIATPIFASLNEAHFDTSEDEVAANAQNDFFTAVVPLGPVRLKEVIFTTRQGMGGVTIVTMRSIKGTEVDFVTGDSRGGFLWLGAYRTYPGPLHQDDLKTGSRVGEALAVLKDDISAQKRAQMLITLKNQLKGTSWEKVLR
jgi:hypothetical protein